MKLSQALEEVAAHYVPGVIAYYGKMKPDPWQQAHDDLELVLSTQNEALLDAAADRFVSRCKELSLRFKEEGKAPRRVTPMDGWGLGSEKRVDAWIGRKDKACHCGETKGLKIVPVYPDSAEVTVQCGRCEFSMKAKGAKNG